MFRFLFSSFLDGPFSTGDQLRAAIIHFITLVALVFFSGLGLYRNRGGFTLTGSLFYGLILAVGLSVLLALYWKRVRLAGRLMVLPLALAFIDPSMTYWSPSMLMLGLVFTLLFQMVLDNNRDRIIAVGINVAVYTYVTLNPPGASPLPADDYFSRPSTALATTYFAHILFLGISYFIRREQQKRDEVQLLVEQQRADVLRQFLDYASHDLRTPLTKIGLKLHLLEAKSSDTNSQRAIVDLKDYVGELESLLLSMLEMASLDSLNEFAPSRTNPDVVIVEVMALYSARAKEKQLALTHRSQLVDTEINVDQVYFRRALSNILDNALAHTPEAGRIEVLVSRNPDDVLIEIKDTGEGIADEHIPFIFDRFYRADAARNQETGRNGLGLAIARKIIELHGGHIDVKSELGAGSAFTITVPLYHPS